MTAVGGELDVIGSEVVFVPQTNYFGPASFQYRVRDNGTTSGTNDFKESITTVTFTIASVNDPPTIAGIANVTVNEDAGLQTVNLTGITAGGGESQVLVVSASSSNPGLIPIHRSATSARIRVEA